jgi:hypothetical protein
MTAARVSSRGTPVTGDRGSRSGCRDGWGEHQPGTASARSRRTPLLTTSTQGALVARWRRTCRPLRAIVAGRVEAKVAWFHGDSDEVSGSPRILADLRGDGEVISRKTVAKTMRKLHLKRVCPKRWRTTTLINHADAYPVDAAKRDWDKGALNRVWVGDITYLRTWQGWPRSSTPTRVGSSAGPSTSTCAPTWSRTPWPWPSRCVGTSRPRSCSTLIMPRFTLSRGVVVWPVLEVWVV